MQPFSEIDHKYDIRKTNSTLTHIPFWPIIPQRCRHGLFYTWDKGKMTAKSFSKVTVSFSFHMDNGFPLRLAVHLCNFEGVGSYCAWPWNEKGLWQSIRTKLSKICHSVCHQLYMYQQIEPNLPKKICQQIILPIFCRSQFVWQHWRVSTSLHCNCSW